MEGSASATIPQPLPSIQTRTRTPVIDVQMDVVPKVSLNLGQTSVQDRDQWLPWLVTKPGRQEAKAAKLQLGLTTLPGHRCAQIHRQTDNNGVCLFVFGLFFFSPTAGNSFGLCVTDNTEFNTNPKLYLSHSLCIRVKHKSRTVYSLLVHFIIHKPQKSLDLIQFLGSEMSGGRKFTG